MVSRSRIISKSAAAKTTGIQLPGPFTRRRSGLNEQQTISNKLRLTEKININNHAEWIMNCSSVLCFPNSCYGKNERIQSRWHRRNEALPDLTTPRDHAYLVVTFVATVFEFCDLKVGVQLSEKRILC